MANKELSQVLPRIPMGSLALLTAIIIFVMGCRSEAGTSNGDVGVLMSRGDAARTGLHPGPEPLTGPENAFGPMWREVVEDYIHM